MITLRIDLRGFDAKAVSFKPGDQALHRHAEVRDRRRFAVAGQTGFGIVEFHHKIVLDGARAVGDGPRMTQGQFERVEFEFEHGDSTQRHRDHRAAK